MKNLRLLIPAFILAVASVAFYIYLIKPGSTICSTSYQLDTSIKIGARTIAAEVADSPSEQEKGLSGRECIGSRQGMLFVNDKPGRYGFWMKDMKFPIDIIWIGTDKKVVKVQASVSPDTYPQTFTNEEPAQYILELGSGETDRLGIKKTTQLTF